MATAVTREMANAEKYAPALAKLSAIQYRRLVKIMISPSIRGIMVMAAAQT
jgi:hypothetical protein